MKSPRTKPPFPSKDDLVACIGNRPGKIGTREIARAFGMKNADRATLKRMLQELSDEGRVERRRRKLHHPGTLPHVVLADVAARAADGMGRGRARACSEDPTPCCAPHASERSRRRRRPRLAADRNQR